MDAALSRPLSLLLAALVSVSPVAAQPPEGATVVVASINGYRITDDEFERAVYSIGRGSMYHGRPAEESKYLAFRRDVLEQLVQRRLLLDAAKTLGIEADQAEIDNQLADYERRYSTTERWQREGDRLVASLRNRLTDDALLARLEEVIRTVDEPTPAELRSFYERNLQSFTEPKRDHLSVILLGVSPSAGTGAWQAARQEAQEIRRRILAGAAFSEMARLHSSDASADAGGDMGYLHDGMLSAAAQAAVDALAVGGISESVTVLEGIAIFHLMDRKPAELQPLEKVSARAAGLWRRTTADEQWLVFLDNQREAAAVSINEEYLASVPVAR